MPVILSNYNIIEQVHEGINTIIYRGERSSDRVPVMIKALRSDYPTPWQLASLRHEYEIIKNLDLPGVVKTYGMEQWGNWPALILEDLDGQPLSTLIAVRRPDLTTFLHIAITLADTLGALHQRNIIHKDLKPQNILINPQTGQVKITDFGIATQLSQENQPAGPPQHLEGTLAYIAPEQTGRMNRAIDYRTDFYSLGVTFYELLTGKLPFLTLDPMELIHSHIARTPLPPHEVSPTIPRPVSEIVMKSLAKAAEDRYQSADGLKADLQECLSQWQVSGIITAFPLGRHDVSSVLRISQRLYGREKDIATLMAAFERVSQGANELMLVAGYSGIGKTVLVNEVHKPIARQHGFFIAGKFEQYRRNIPYASIIQAFQDLIRQLSGESAERLDNWRLELREALGANAQVIVDVIPEVEQLIGAQAPVPQLGPTETRARFNLVFQQFLRVFARPEHPLAVFMDDMQWADLASLQLIQAFATDPDTRHLLLICAYRDNEVATGHPLQLTLNDICKNGAAVSSVTLSPLGLEHIARWLAGTLDQQPPQTLPLAELVQSKTDGNPFFLNQFLKSLHEEQLLSFDPRTNAWRWDLEGIRSAAITDNVVDFMAGKIRKLAPGTQRVLQLAACIGNQFDLRLLALIAEQSLVETSADLWVAIQEGLILPLDAGYKLIAGQEAELAAMLAAPDFRPTFKFLHDRVQQAAYSLIPADQTRLVHLAIGRLLLEDASDHWNEERVFDIVNQLNIGVELITQPDERLELARLNLIAGQKARASAANASAAGYLATAMELLPAASWDTHYDLTLAIHQERLVCEYLTGQVEIADALFDTVQERARRSVEKAEVYATRISLYTSLGRFPEAMAIGMDGLRLFGISFPDTDEQLQAAVGAALGKVQQNLGSRQAADLLDAPELADPDKKVVMRLLAQLVTPTFNVNLNVFILVVLEMANISLQYGNTTGSAFAYSGYGMLLSSLFGDYPNAEAFGRLALDLNERFNDAELQHRTRNAFGGFIDHWRNHVRSSTSYLRQAYLDSIAIGDLAFASFPAMGVIYGDLGAGVNLGEVLEETRIYLEFLRQSKNEAMADIFTLYQQIILNLQGQTSSVSSLSDATFDEETFVNVTAKNSLSALASYYVYKAQVLYLHGHYVDALTLAVEAERLSAIFGSTYTGSEFVFYAALIQVAVYPTLPEAEQPARLEMLERNRAQMQMWANNCPENSGSRYALIAAEMARIAGDDREAAQRYDEAITLATTHGFIQNAAIANELAAKFYLAREKRTYARGYLLEAYEGYQKWGATAKATALVEKYSGLIGPVATAAQSEYTNHKSFSSTSLLTLHRHSGLLDVTTVIKAAQVISGEIVLDQLLAKLMKIVIENAGAQRGVLVLERDGRLTVEAAITADEDMAVTRTATPIESSTLLAPAIVQFVVRTRRSLVLQDAAQDKRFANAPYVLLNQPKSILALPLIHQGHLTGVLYLENNLATNAFTPEQIELLSLLSLQAAIAIENARLYTHVQQRTEELAQAVAEAQAARAAAEQANELKSQFLANMSHELRTPLNSIINFTQILNTGRRGPITDGQRDLLNRVRHSGEHLLGLINDILDLSKIEAGRMDLYIEQIDLAELVPSVLETAAGLTKGKPIKLHKEIPDELPLVEADRTRIRQILLNLLSNAAKFTDEGSIMVRVVREAEQLVVQVADTGIGIAPEHLGAIFEEFRQIDGASNRRYEGTGLGLAIVCRLLELHHGRIWVESTPGVGSTFFFSLPITVEPQATEPMLATRYTAADHDGIPILVIDDDSAGIEIVAAYLERDGYTIYGITDSRWALNEVRRIQPAAIILDVLMPYKDGWEILTELKADPDLQAVPVALYTIVEEQKLGFYIGASAYLVKPINELQLRTTVSQLVTPDASIIVIDDDPNALEIVANHLEQAGPYHVITADNGRKGLERIAEKRPDLIILDLMMPEVDGFAVLEQLDRDPQTRKLPVIVLTAKDLTREEHRYLQQRVSGLLAKGCSSPEQLLGKVSALLTTVAKRPLVVA